MLQLLIRVSEGTAAALGLSRSRPETYPSAAYFLLGDGCTRSCAFCAQGQQVPARYRERLGRAFWPEYPWKAVEEAWRRSSGGSLFQRVCLQAVRFPGTLAPLRQSLARLADLTHLPVSVSARIQDVAEAADCFQAGADRVAVSLDAASSASHWRAKGESFSRRVELLKECARAWPGRVSTHLICGLGETDAELLDLAADLLRNRVTVALFAFTPLPGTPLARQEPPPLERYRRVQVALHLLHYEPDAYAHFRFRRGQLVDFGRPDREIRGLLAGGEAFQTCGCPGCNRPYFNERPGQALYNYPRPLNSSEALRALGLALGSESSSGSGDCTTTS